MLKICKELFGSWNRTHLKYCHWKSNEHLQEGLNGITDLDVLLAFDDKESGVRILEDLQFLHCRSQYGSRYPYVEDWIGFDDMTGMLVHLHLHYVLITGHKGMKEYELPWKEECLKTRILDMESSVYVMNPNLELVTLYTRIGLKSSFQQLRLARKGIFSVGKNNTKEIDYLKERIDWKIVTELANRYYKSSAVDFLNIMKLEELDSKSFLHLHALTTKVMSSNSRYHGISLFLHKWYYIIALRFIRWLRYSKDFNIIVRKTPNHGHGLVIAFIGQDGAGKSTVTKDIEKWLTWKLDARQFYLGSGEHFNPWEKRLILSINKNNSSILHLLKSVLSFRLIKKIADNACQNIKIATNYAKEGGIALLDRFPQVKYAGINDGPKIRFSVLPHIKNPVVRRIVELYAKKEEKSLIEATSYQPDVVIKLLLSPEESIRRKPMEKIDIVRTKHQIIKNLNFSGSTVYDIDATMDYEEELRLVKRIIWNHILHL